jgi:LAO/AO transport system kinase
MSQAGALFERLRAGDRAALARAITLVESVRPDDAALSRELALLALPFTGHGARIGITGIPGVGKSTLIDAFGLELLRNGHRVAVLAVDPSSARTGGSILGDKTRMERLAQEEGAFIRPTAAGGTLGGVARRTREAMLLCEAAGYDHVLVETVGVGQNELAVDRLTDMNLLLTIPGAGDELQGIKRGIMESADVVVLTKADAADPAAVRQAHRDLRNAIALLPRRPDGHQTQVLLTDAVTGRGMKELAAHVATLHRTMRESGALDSKRRDQAVGWFADALHEGLVTLFESDPRIAAAKPAIEAAVREGRTTPVQAAHELLALFRTGA